MSGFRILIVDDHDAVRKALRRLLTAEGWDVCGEAADGMAAIEVARRLQPDLILMDLLMPGMFGIDAAKKILEEFPAIAILLMTAPDPEVVQAAHAVGIRGIVWKGTGNFVETIRAIARDSGTNREAR